MIRKKCLVCGDDVFVKNYHEKKGWGKYCSKACQAKDQIKGKWLECDNCGKQVYRTPKDFKRSKSGKFFCSVNCHCSWENKNSRCGEKAPNWTSGQTAYRALLKRHGAPEACAACSIEDKRVLVVHHRDSNRKNNKPENLQWLCRNCHCLAHYKK